jgi:RND family efflux transporter MFP subunit
MSMLRAHGSLLALAASGLLIAALAACGEEAPPPELPPRAIRWQRVSASLAADRRVISGIVTAISDTRLAFEVGGTVQSVEVNLGDHVEQDQILARLDPEPFELVVRDAEAALAEARALRAAARAEYERTARMYAARVASRQTLEQITAQRDSRDSQYQAAEARLELVRRDLRRSVLRAPFRGSISARAVDPAMKVATGETAFEVDSEESGLRVEVQMPETLITRVRQGDAVEVGFPSKEAGFEVGDRRFEAVVSEVGTRAGVANAFPVRADLRDPPAGLRPGMTAEVTFSLPRDAAGLAGFEGFMIPIAAALAEPDDSFSVFVYDGETSTVRKRPVRTGGVGDNVIAVLEGLEEGDVIATAGVTFLREGQQVTLLDDRLLRNTR